MSNEEIRTPMPQDPPSYYARYNIPTIDGYYFWDQGGWTWKIGTEEKPHADKAEEFHANTPVTKTTRSDYSSIMYEGRWRTVWTDGTGRDYVEIEGAGRRFYLYDDWWKTNESRRNAEQHGYVGRIKTAEEVFGEAYSPLKGVKKITLPEIGLGAKMGFGLTAGVVVLFAGVIAMLLALGYSGTGGSVGRVAEKEHGRKR